MQDTDAFLSLCAQRMEVIRLIPDVKPNLALQTLEQAIFNTILEDEVAPIGLTEVDVTGAMTEHCTRSGMPRHVITPRGAALLKKLTEAGLIPRKKSGPPDLARLDAYIATEPKLREEAQKLEEARRATAAQRDLDYRELETRAAHLAEHPEDARLEEIDAILINQVIVAKYGAGRPGEILLAGCRCHKEIDLHISNSGNRSASARIHWTTPDGRTYGKPDAPAPNRRMDPERNWGAGRG